MEPAKLFTSRRACSSNRLPSPVIRLLRCWIPLGPLSGSQLFHQRDDQEPAQPVGSILLPTRAIPRVKRGTINNGDTNRLSEPSIHHHLTQRRLRRVRERSPFIGGLLCLSRYMRAQAPSPTMTCGRYKRLRYTISVRVGITPSAREA